MWTRPVLQEILFTAGDRLHVFDAVDEGFELAAAAWVTELAKCLRFDLADALVDDLERLTDLLEGVLAAVFKAEAHLDDALFARSQGAEDLSITNARLSNPGLRWNCKWLRPKLPVRPRTEDEYLDKPLRALGPVRPRSNVRDADQRA